jgi:hypothetical protein
MYSQNKTEELNFRIFIDHANGNKVAFSCI